MQPVDSAYGFSTRSDLPYARAIERVTAALKAEGFGVLTEIDVRATLKAKLGADFRPYVILGACNPHLAHKALTAEPEIGLLLPCNVIVYEDEGGGSRIAIIDPVSMMGFVSNPALDDIAQEARERLERVRAAITD